MFNHHNKGSFIGKSKRIFSFNSTKYFSSSIIGNNKSKSRFRSINDVNERAFGVNGHVNSKINGVHGEQFSMINGRKYTRYPGRVILDVDPEIPVRTRVMISVYDYPGILEDILSVFRKNCINLTRIESRYGQNNELVNFFIDIAIAHNDKRINRVFQDFEGVTEAVSILGPKEVPWFPITKEECDSLALLVLEGGTDLHSDHPGFTDEEYKKRRKEISKFASEHKYGDSPKRVIYIDEEKKAWELIWNRIEPLLYKHAAPEYLKALEGLQKHCGYTKDDIPQLCDVSQYLNQTTGFTLRPTAGLLSSRYFLNGLAFKTFFCTQYLRHHTVPFYTPEPDVVHELVGHAPLFADPDFAAFSQEIGLASIGASDDEITQLARCYWFTVEFGLCLDDNGERKIMGAGILSSFGETEYAMGYPEVYKNEKPPEYREWDPEDASKQDFPITKYQPIYYIANSFNDAKEKLVDFTNGFKRPFTVKWNEKDKKLIVDAPIRRSKPTMDIGVYVGTKNNDNNNNNNTVQEKTAS